MTEAVNVSFQLPNSPDVPELNADTTGPHEPDQPPTSGSGSPPACVTFGPGPGSNTPHPVVTSPGATSQPDPNQPDAGNDREPGGSGSTHDPDSRPGGGDTSSSGSARRGRPSGGPAGGTARPGPSTGSRPARRWLDWLWRLGRWLRRGLTRIGSQNVGRNPGSAKTRAPRAGRTAPGGGWGSWTDYLTGLWHGGHAQVSSLTVEDWRVIVVLSVGLIVALGG